MSVLISTQLESRPGRGEPRPYMQFPRCGTHCTGARESTCAECSTRVVKANGIWRALPADRARHFRQFIRLTDGEGPLAKGGVADRIALLNPGGTPATALVEAGFQEAEPVPPAERLRLLPPTLAARRPEESRFGLKRQVVTGVARYWRAPVGRRIPHAPGHLGRTDRSVGRYRGAL